MAEGGDVPDKLTTVLVVDDHQLLAESVAMALELMPGLRCAGTAGTVAAALDAIGRSRPDVVLMDLGLPGIDGIEGIRMVRRQHPGCRVLACTGTPDAQALVDAAEAGAAGFVPKHVPLVRLAEAVLDRSRCASASVVRTMLGCPPDRGSPSRAGDVDPHLTAQEQDLLQRLADGSDVEQIARHLGIPVTTCRRHVQQMCESFGVHTPLAVLVRAVQSGLLPARSDRRSGNDG